MINISNIEKLNLSDIIASEIKDRIINDVWKVGEKIPSENKLSEEFEVNRLTIRLAINKLNALGVLETKTGEGTYVKKINLYNYINQLIPFIISSNEINHILEFENTILSLLEGKIKFNDNEIEYINQVINVTKINIKKLESLYDITKSYDKDILNNIATDYFGIKKILFQKTTNSLLKSIILSFEQILIENDIEQIKSLNRNDLIVLIDRIEDLARRYE
ncbi:GntR family transcriptional regulator [uncultured Helcococcus sp.]|uniref:FadR/GntR family transcriptional regulator n=1 Tax=uncultured Helcococcus sp. TaxID=1072508 RepID=UPI00261F7AA4|nr:GntR family transcriptional regulator [uncultured Helcococcus sp.]